MPPFWPFLLSYLHPEFYDATLKLGARGVVVERIDVSERPLYPIPSALTTELAAAEAAADVTPRSAKLYISGGPWIREAAPSHWTFAAQAIRETGLDVLLPINPFILRPTAMIAELFDGPITSI
ncbi:uncharacterized protein B0I36DRAFT_362322 [Microdochium trichocladiopsis]|uniref:Uncharacterized protein n=1 Tax=Microdochium trichocladiopsis TaxID=1682393 RepID=A0A9P8Y9J6_9PEZI|nr:uncharacterized protein B0I36DRAFT_362322 [Microdochium trichocladiopsis]KAH7033679.1 hypothetical protein B0I36DRAFT_362322 [Microdochium trichocladiopsis]